MTEGRLFSRLVRVDALPREGQVVAIEATPAEREALASFYRLPAIAALTATLRLDPWGRGGARVIGAVYGELTQVCVVSLEPFPATVDEDVDVRFAPQTVTNSRSTATEATQTFSLADEDEPDPVVDGKIDLGALTAELFALGLDPYPRKPGAVLDEERSNSDPTNSPFAALAQRGKAGND
jgi:Large ribosomal RNA subunit accumulation protein YceD